MSESVVHQMKDTSQGVTRTKCGLEGKKLRTSGFQSRVTCPDCAPPRPPTDLESFFEPFAEITESRCDFIVFAEGPCPNAPVEP